MREKIQTLLTHLNHNLVDREPQLKAALLAVLAGENIVLVGPPGTGKSLLARRIAESLGNGAEGLSYFEYLLTKFSTPEEIFGPLSITALKADRFHRNTVGYLPQVELAFLDEVFKASSSILNALLTLMNERVFHNGADVERAPLRSIIAASNELPTGQEELSALYDRFLLRCFVDYVSADHLHLLLAASAGTEPEPHAALITQSHLQAIKTGAKAVTIPDMVAQALQEIWTTHRNTFKEDRRESLSDRRLMKCLNLLRVSAFTNGRSEADLSDLLLLKDCLWSYPDNAPKVVNLIKATLQKHSVRVLATSASNLGSDEASSGTLTTPANNSSEPTGISAPKGQMNAVVKGFRGSGTRDDPLLVETVADLADLARAEVGMKGYHFQQIAKLDCSSMGTWPEINFQGVYDGQMNKIIFSKIENQNLYLFNQIKEKSIIRNLKIHERGLAKKVTSSRIESCSCHSKPIQRRDGFNLRVLQGTGKPSAIEIKKFALLDHSEKSDIVACRSDGNIISESARDSNITRCTSNEILIQGEIVDSIISECTATFSITRNARITSSKILNCLITDAGEDSLFIVCDTSRSTYIEKCFAFNLQNSMSTRRNGFSGDSYRGHIKDCMMGIFRTSNFRYRIANRDHHSSQTLTNNYSLDLNTCQSSLYTRNDDRDGESISIQLCTQRFFENTLGWDFENIWAWDIRLNQPTLRHSGQTSPQDSNTPVPDDHPRTSTTTSATQVNALTQQVQSNIWL